MIETLVVIAAATTLFLLARRANRRFARHARLPMQWSLAGRVTWTAPRALALALMPLLGTATLAAAALSSQLLTPRAGQEGLEIPVLLLLSGVCIAVQLLHLTLIDRTLRRGES